MNNQAAQTMPLPAPNKIAHDLLIDLRAAAAIGRPITGDEIHEIEQRMIAALSQTAGVAEGMVKVPIFPTPEMDAAGKAALSANGVDCVEDSDALVCYAAMLAAAPAASGGDSAASVSERARELLATEYDNEGVHGLAESIRAGTFTTHLDQCSINAITNALASAPDGFALVPVEPTAAMKDAGDYSKWNYDDAADIYKAMLRASGYAARGTKELVIALEQALTQQRGDGEAVDRDAWAEALELPQGYTVEEFLPGGWHYAWTRADGERMVSGTTWNHPALAAIAAWQYAPATTPQPGAEALREAQEFALEMLELASEAHTHFGVTLLCEQDVRHIMEAAKQLRAAMEAAK